MANDEMLEFKMRIKKVHRGIYERDDYIVELHKVPELGGLPVVGTGNSPQEAFGFAFDRLSGR